MLDKTMDWSDRIELQTKYSLEEKGWHVKVEWRSTPYGAGVFSGQDIVKGSILRTGILGINLKEFTSEQEIIDFCKTAVSVEEANARLAYVQDYLWGFNPYADERGYDRLDAPPPSRFFGMWIPGNGLNHNLEPNVVYQMTSKGIDLVALTDMAKDTELVDDYRRHGLAPLWLKEFAQKHSITLNFADCNEFVGPLASD
eukprot:Nitzschia sp. Nitz4//NODE_464_length_17123_cov_69.824057//6891//7487//NITZ4_additional_000063-RA//1//CDS//3329531915//4974//frame0